MTKDNFETSCQTCVCRFKRGQKKEKQCWSTLRAPTRSTTARLHFDCSDQGLRSIEASLYQVSHRTTANEPLITVQQIKGQRCFEAWHAIVRRCEQRDTSDKKSAYAALMKEIEPTTWSRTFINETNKFENIFGTNRDEETVLTFKKLMPDKLVELQTLRNDDVVQ